MFVHKLITLISVLLLTLNLQATEFDDKEALKGVDKGKVLFDINIVNNPKKLSLYLMVIKETYDDLVRQNVEPNIVLAFRGKAIKLVSTQQDDEMVLKFEAYLNDVAVLIEELQQKGVRMEACGVAMRLLNISPNTLLKGITPVGNTFVSILGYNAQGYATISIY